MSGRLCHSSSTPCQEKEKEKLISKEWVLLGRRRDKSSLSLTKIEIEIGEQTNRNGSITAPAGLHFR